MEAMASKAPTLPLLGGLRKRTRSGVDYKDMDVSLENSSDETDALRKMRKFPLLTRNPKGLTQTLNSGLIESLNDWRINSLHLDGAALVRVSGGFLSITPHMDSILHCFLLGHLICTCQISSFLISEHDP
jgi:hypothetical protein